MAKKKVESKVIEKPAAAVVTEETKPTENEKLATREKRELSLYDYGAEILEIESAIQAAEGELTDEQADQLLALHAGSIVKMKSYVWMIRQIGGVCENIDGEIKRLSEIKKYRQNIQGRLEAALLRHILLTQPEKKQIDLDTYIVSAKKNPPSVEVDEGFSDPFLCDIKSIKNPSAETIDAAKANGDELVITPNKPAIKEALQAKQDVPGARLIDDKYRLNIK
jgi:hypothetical protein